MDTRNFYGKLAQTAGMATGYDVLVTDEHGMVTDCTDKSRIGTLHEASLHVIVNRRAEYHGPEEAQKLKGTRPGVTIPIVFDGVVCGTVGITGSPEEISKYTSLVHQLAQLFINFQSHQLTETQTDYQKQLLVKEIISFNSAENSLDPSIAYKLGFNLNLPRIAFIAETANDSESMKERLSELSKIFNDPQDIICALRNNCYAAMVSAGDGESEKAGIDVVRGKCMAFCSAAREGTIKVGIGSYAENVEQLHHSYKNASFALGVLKKQQTAVTCASIYDVLLEKIAADIPPQTAECVSDLAFKNIMKSKHRGEAYRIVKSWCESRFNFSLTAKMLYIHKSTLSYRFERIKEQYGIDLYDFNKTMALYLLFLKNSD